MTETTLPGEKVKSPFDGMIPVAPEEVPSFEDPPPAGMIPVAPGEAPVFTQPGDPEPIPATEPEGEDFLGGVDSPFSQPPGAKKPATTMFGKMTDRFFGTDVNDPLTLERTGTMVGGGYLGASAGARVPFINPFVNPITGVLVGGVAGTVAGAVAPETMLEVMEYFKLLPEGAREEIGLSPSDLATLVQGEILIEVATGGGITLARGGTRVFTQFVTGSGTKTRQAIAKTAKERFGIDLAPVQIGKRTLGRGFVNVMGRFPFIGSKLRKFAEGTEAQIENAFQTLGNRVGTLVSDAELSQLIYKNGRELLKKTNKYFNERYTAVFERATEFGVRVTPRHTVETIDRLLNDILKKTPVGADGVPIEGEVLAKVRKMLLKHRKLSIDSTTVTAKGSTVGDINVALGAPRVAETTETTTKTADLTLDQLDGLLDNVDQFLSTLEPSQQGFAINILKQFKQGVQMDLLESVNGPIAAEITASLRALDEEFSLTMSQIFETSAAKAFGTVRSKGIKGMVAQEATQVQVDLLSKTIIRLDSPQAMEEISRLVTPDTLKSIAAKILDDAVELSSKNKSGEFVGFSTTKFRNALGLGKKTSPRTKALEVLLTKTESKLKIADLKDLVEVSRAIEGLKIVPASTFLQRKAVIGGMTGFIRGMMPGIAIGTAAGTKVGRLRKWGTGLMSMAMFVGGGKMVTRMLTDPRLARPLKEVLAGEADNIALKSKVQKILRLLIDGTFKDGGLVDEVAETLQQTVPIMTEMWDREVDSLGFDEVKNAENDISEAIEEQKLLDAKENE
jgi:hypothetical protein